MNVRRLLSVAASCVLVVWIHTYATATVCNPNYEIVQQILQAACPNIYKWQNMKVLWNVPQGTYDYVANEGYGACREYEPVENTPASLKCWPEFYQPTADRWQQGGHDYGRWEQDVYDGKYPSVTSACVAVAPARVARSPIHDCGSVQSPREECEDQGWYWNFSNNTCNEEPVTCPEFCRPYQYLEQGGCYDPVDYCGSEWGCSFGLTDGGQGCCCGGTPIVVDIQGDGFSLTDAYNGTNFDLGGDGHREPIAWTAESSDDAWLCLDRNGNGQIDSGKELFGNFTDQSHASGARNGFHALAEFDQVAEGGNGDGLINSRDSIFASLRLWQDLNHNGMSEANELHGLPEMDVQSISLDYKEAKKTDVSGNAFRYRAKAMDAQGRQAGRWAWDVLLQVNPEPKR